METVEVDVDGPKGLQKLLLAIERSSHIEYDHAQPIGIRCRVVIAWQGESLELFAIAAADGFRFTDDPGDLGFQITRFRESLGEALAQEPSVSTPDSTASLTGTPVVPTPASPVNETLPDDSDDYAGEAWPEPGDDFDDEMEEEDDEESEESPRSARAPDSRPPPVGGPENNPLLIERKRIQKLPVPQKLKLAAAGDLTQRTLLFRMYGKLVFEALLRNPRLTEMEVTRLAKLGTMPTPLLQQIGMRPDWLRSERVRNALLGNPRLPLPIAHKIISMLSRQDLKAMVTRRDLPQGVQAALRARLK